MKQITKDFHLQENNEHFFNPKTRNQSRFTVKSLDELFVPNKTKSDNVIKSTANYVKKYYKPSRNCMKDYFFARFPFFLWIFKYDFKENTVKDLISGITIGVVHIPQGIFECFLKINSLKRPHLVFLVF
jgi:hypothetical protein